MRRSNLLSSTIFLAQLLVVNLLVVKEASSLSLKLDHQRTRRDIFRSTAAVATLASSGVDLIGSNQANAVETTSSPFPSSSNEVFLMPEYYDNIPVTAASKGRFYFPTLTPPFNNRATYRYDLGRDTWAFEQLLTFSNVTATIKTNVVRLKSGGLWVHSPQWPTGEFCHLLDELGTVEHVVLPCNAFEHAAPVKAFCKKYPKASVWVSPGQYGPFGSCGKTLEEPCNLGYKVQGIFGDNSESDSNLPPWIDEFEYTSLYVNLPENAGPVSEVAFVHKPSKTLIVTDGVVYIPDTPSKIFATYFDESTLSETSFWPKTVLQSVFLPLRVDDTTGGYPGYEAIQGRLLRAPILRGFNDARAPILTSVWIDEISKWNFDRIITNHFASPIGASPTNLKAAFAFLDGSNKESLPPIICQDWELLDSLNEFIGSNKIGAPATFDYKADCIQY